MGLRVLSLLLVAILAAAGRAAAACDAAPPVCEARRYVLPLIVDAAVASGVYIGRGRLVTNRHVVAGRRTVAVRLPGGSRDVRIVPTAYPGDLVLLTAEGLDLGPPPPLAAAVATGSPLRVIAATQEAGSVTVYPAGRLLLPAAPEKPLARLQHDAPGALGSSGGYLADAAGALAGVVTTGAADLGEAIPASEIERLVALSGDNHQVAHERLSAAYAGCLEGLRHVPDRRGRLPQRLVTHVTRTCSATGNRQLVSRAGELLGRAGHLDEARELFGLALDGDPHSLEARQGLVVALHLAGLYAEAVPHIRWLMGVLPREAEILRLAIQGGKLSGEGALAEEAYDRLQQHHPALAVPMRRFLDSPLPPGFQRQ